MHRVHYSLRLLVPDVLAETSLLRQKSQSPTFLSTNYTQRDHVPEAAIRTPEALLLTEGAQHLLIKVVSIGRASPENRSISR